MHFFQILAKIPLSGTVRTTYKEDFLFYPMSRKFYFNLIPYDLYLKIDFSIIIMSHTQLKLKKIRMTSGHKGRITVKISHFKNKRKEH